MNGAFSWGDHAEQDRQPSDQADPGAGEAGDTTTVLLLSDVHKRFGGVRALRGANLTIRHAGVVHGLVGENGSGKSTLLGVLSGQLRPDRGTIQLAGSDVTLRSPADALRLGIAMVSQEIAIAPHLSIAENVLMGHRLAGSPGRINWTATRRRVADILGALQVDYDPRWLVSRLRPDQRQMVEIARALSMNARVLILDEPTSSLTAPEVDALFATIRRLKTQGVSIIFVSHRLSELFDLADEVTVLRDGRTVAAGATADFDPNSLITAMIGNQSALRYAEPQRPPRRFSPGSPVALRIRSLAANGVLANINLDVESGEIVGLAGLGGAGRGELLECVFGARAVDAGTIEIGGQAVDTSTPRHAVSHGLGFLPPDRKTQGLVLTMSLNDNLTMVSSLQRGRLARPRRTRESSTVAQLVTSLNIRAPSPLVPAGALSGGNQQKVALGKWLLVKSRVLLLDEPTRGVDVAAKAEIHKLLREIASEGVGLLVSSSENDELLALCNRIVVMFRGRVVAALASDQFTEATLARYAGGLS